jgi:hypothetical protein
MLLTRSSNPTPTPTVPRRCEQEKRMSNSTYWNRYWTRRRLLGAANSARPARPALPRWLRATMTTAAVPHSPWPLHERRSRRHDDRRSFRRRPDRRHLSSRYHRRPTHHRSVRHGLHHQDRLRLRLQPPLQVQDRQGDPSWRCSPNGRPRPERETTPDGLGGRSSSSRREVPQRRPRQRPRRHQR